MPTTSMGTSHEPHHGSVELIDLITLKIEVSLGVPVPALSGIVV
jgi:hypothetical protein